MNDVLNFYNRQQNFDPPNLSDAPIIREVGSYMVEHGNWPIFSMEFGKIVYILADFGKQEYCQTRKFCVLKDGIRQSYNPTDTNIA